MIPFTNFAVAVLGQLTVNLLINQLGNNKSDIDRAYDDALERTKAWYEERYGDQYGTRTNRYFDYRIGDNSLEEMLLVENPMSAHDIAARLKKEYQCEFPSEVIDALKDRLLRELEKNQITAPLLRAIRNASQLKKNAANTERTADRSAKILAAMERLTKGPTPVDLNALRERYFTFLIERYSRLEFKGFSEKMLTIPIKSLYTRLAFSRDLPKNRIDYLKSLLSG